MFLNIFTLCSYHHNLRIWSPSISIPVPISSQSPPHSATLPNPKQPLIYFLWIIFSRLIHMLMYFSTSFVSLPNNIPLHKYTTFYLFISGHLGCFYLFLAIMNNVAINISVQGFAWISILISFGHKARIAGSYGSSIFNFLRNCQTPGSGRSNACLRVVGR